MSIMQMEEDGEFLFLKDYHMAREVHFFTRLAQCSTAVLVIETQLYIYVDTLRYVNALIWYVMTCVGGGPCDQ